MNIIKSNKPRLNKDEAAQMLGLKVYDTALPQPWLDDLFLKMALSPASRTGQFLEDWKGFVISSLVWCYDKDDKGSPSLFGYPVVLTKKCLDLLDLECVQKIWDFQSQAAVIETRETYILEGTIVVCDVIQADDQEQAEMIFRAKYRAVKITAVKVKQGNNIVYTKDQPKE